MQDTFGKGAELYGEVTIDGVRAAIRAMRAEVERAAPLAEEDLDGGGVRVEVHGSSWDQVANSGFVDLGSGIGKAVIQAYLEYGLRGYGIEFSSERHMMALGALGRLRDQLAKADVSNHDSCQVPEPRFLRGDISVLGIWPPAVRLFLVNCPSWPTSLKSALAKNLIEHSTRLKKTLYLVVTQPTALTELEDMNPIGLRHTLADCSTTWRKDLSCQLYTIPPQHRRRMAEIEIEQDPERTPLTGNTQDIREAQDDSPNQNDFEEARLGCDNCNLL